VVYLMFRHGMGYRVGWCQLFNAGRLNHFAARCRLEKADAGWILRLYDNKRSASINEKIIATRYGLPLVTFRQSGDKYLDDEGLAQIFSGIVPSENAERGLRCLRDFNLCEEYPMWPRASAPGFPGQGGRNQVMSLTYASNLIPGIMSVPTGNTCHWEAISGVKMGAYSGVVHSLDVDTHGAYQADGLVVHNSIYEWRGGNPKLFMAFGESARIYGLRNSYRFGFNIAAPAQALIAHNVERINMAIRAISTNAGTVEVHDSLPYDEIAGIIRRELEGGRPPADIAVLARRHKTLQPLDDVLTAAGIPFYRVGAEQAIPQTPEFRILRAYLRLGQNPRDNRAFMRLAVAEGLDTAALLDLRQAANDHGTTLAAAYGKTLPGTLAALAPYLVATDTLRDYRPAFDYAAALMRDNALADERELLDHLATASVSDQVKDVKDRVTLGTIHHAKGLEWPVVLLIGLNSQQFPSPRSIREGRQEEERRLAYVAMTRAEQTLYLISTPPEGPRDGQSSFLGEIGDVRRMDRDPWGGDDLVM
jgi:hypothetical protein